MVTRQINRPVHLGDFLDPSQEVIPGYELDAMYEKNSEAFSPDMGLTDKEIETRALARRMMRHFIPFTFPEYKIDQFHLQVCDDIDRVVHLDHERPITHLMLNAPPQHGKALALDTPIPVPGGWTTIESIEIGDALFDDSGAICRVVAKTPPQRNRRLYRISTDDGDEIIADAEHEWLVRLDRKHKALTIRTSQYLANRTSPRSPLVPIQGPLDLPDVELAVDPYVLGVWLGDGKNDCGFITSVQTDDRVFLKSQIEEAGYVCRLHKNPKNFGVLGLLVKLRKLGVLGSKHIPAQYFRASKVQRLRLLQGLIDSDGHVARDGQVEFCNTNTEIAGGVQELVRSLGYKASLVIGRATLYGKDCGIKYRVMFYMPDAALLPRKRERCIEPKKVNRYIQIKPAGTGRTICIQVDSPSRLFLCGKSMMPTHNSEIVSTRLPAYWLAHNPDLPVALVSYAQDLANRNSRNARGVFESDQYRQLFAKLGILKDSENWRVRDWHLSGHKGYAFAAGVGGPITGRGFGCAIIDDPIENWAAAQSETIRDSVFEWWKGTLKTRLWPGYRVIFMMTRWHEDDLQARILEQEGRRDYCTSCNHYFADEYDPEKCPECGGDRGRWTVRSYAALAETQEERDEIARNAGLREGTPDLLGREPREPLAPALDFDREFLEQQQIDVGPLVWGAEYQQHPSPPKGDMFKIGQIPAPEASYPVEDFGGQLIKDLVNGQEDYRPVGVKNCVRYWDLAASEKKMGTDPDFTSGTLLGVDRHGITHVLHNTSLQAEPDQVLQTIKDTAALDGKGVKIYIEQEGGASGKSLIKSWQRELVGYIVEGIPSTGSKQTRAYPFAAQVNAGNVRLVKALWNKIWLARHRVFPHGKHDDEVDSTSGAFNEATGGKRWSAPGFKALGR